MIRDGESHREIDAPRDLPMAAGRLSNRQISLDVLRGLAVAAMILVNSPGSWSHVYPPLAHAAWHGWTPADMIFPAFLFSVGAAMCHSLGRRGGAGRLVAAVQVARRGAVLIAIGLALGALSMLVRDAPALRIPGVLQRIGLCFMLGGWLFLATARSDGAVRLRVHRPAIAVTILVLLVGYWLLLSFVPVPGFGAGRLDTMGSLPAWLDRMIFTPAHLWAGAVTPGLGVTYDPEGLLSTLPALATVLIGLLAADWIKGRAPAAAVPRVLAAGIVLAALGLMLDRVFPINKALWTSSFVLLSGGVALGLLGLLIALVDRGGAARLFEPARMFGLNAILVYVASALLGIASTIPFGTTGSDGPMTLQQFGFETVVAVVGDPRLASLLCAIGIVTLLGLALVPLHRRGIFLKV